MSLEYSNDGEIKFLKREMSMKKKIWNFSVGLGAFSALLTGVFATGLFAVACFIGHETVWDIVGGVGWSACFASQVCMIIELYRQPKSVSE